jgi:hypothetical protein
MANTKPLSQVVDKWQRRASVAQNDYTLGVQNPRKPWDQAALDGEENYRQGVTAAANSAGLTKWQTNSLKKGPGRFTEGVIIAGPDFSKKIQMVLQTIQAVTLPERGPKGSPQNFQRVQPIGDALRRAFGKTGTTP